AYQRIVQATAAYRGIVSQIDDAIASFGPQGTEFEQAYQAIFANAKATADQLNEAAKAAGLAPKFDVFTPDACEMAFLADPDAVHPAYISHHLFRAETAQVPELIARACRGKNAAKILVVKGSTDYVVENGKITFTISEPDLPALEAIGGTGDTISGMIGAMIDAGLSHRNAAVAALKANRLAGQIAKATPATKIRRIVEVIPEALKNIL
ncbi:MAG TPA: NAD(P)H-hydrate dehydratase, partial [Smithella sp.]|nr:NAD(P)H-hydrate dehydratase [Smithella sp.]